MPETRLHPLQQRLLERELARVQETRAPENSPEALARQGVASVLDLAVFPPSTLIAPEGARPEQLLGMFPPGPNIAYAIPTLLETGINFATEALGIPYNSTIASELFQEGIETSESIAGTGPPRTTAENAARVIPGALIPIGGAAGKGAASLPRLGAEVIAPGLQSLTARGVALSTVPEFLASEALSEFGDPEFKSSIFDFNNDERTIVETFGLDPSDPLVGAITRDGLSVIPDGDQDFSGELAAGLVAILGAVSARSLMRVHTANKARIAQEAVTELAGSREATQGRSTAATTHNTQGGLTGPVTDRMTVLETQLVDRDAPLLNALEKAGVSTDEAELFRARLLTSVAPQPLSARLHDIAITGQMPNSTVRMPPLANHLEAIARLSPDQRALYNDGLIARTRLDDMRATGVDIWGIGPRQKSRLDLEASVRLSEADPHVLELMNESANMYGRVADYMRESGIISTERRMQWIMENRHYVPLQTDFTSDPRFADAFRGLEPSSSGGDGLRFLDTRRDLSEGVQPGEVREPMRIHEQYLSRIVRNVEHNRVRREFLDLAITNNLTDGSGNAIVSRVRSTGDDTIAVKRDGTTEHYRVEDAAIRNALFFRPQATAGILNSARRMAQELTTGVGRPDFVPVSLMYEMFAAMPMVRTGRALGPLDEALNRLAGVTTSDVGLPDPSVVLSPVTGSLRQATYSSFMQGLARNLDMQMRFGGQLDGSIADRAGGVLYDMLGPTQTQRLRNVLMDAYERSTFRLFQQYGGGNNIFIENLMGGDVPSAITDVAPNFARTIATDFPTQFRADTFSREYLTFLNSLHNSIRLQSAAGSIAKRGVQIISDPDEMTRIMADTRQLTGDVTRVPGDPATLTGRNVQRVLSQSMYANHWVQVTAANARAMRDHPVRYWTTTALMAVGGASFITEQLKNNPAAQNHYWNEMTIEQRGTMMPIYEQDGSIKGLVMIPPEQRVLWSPFIEGVGATFGFKSGDPSQYQSLTAAFQSAMDHEWTVDDVNDVMFGAGSSFANSVLPDPVGPGLRVPIQAATGAEFPNLAVEGMSALTGTDLGGSGGRFRSFEPRPSRVEVNQNAEAIERTRLIVDALFASSARPMIDSANALVRSLDQTASVDTALDNASRAFFGPMREPTRTSPLFQSLWGMDARTRVSDDTHRELMPKLDQIKNVVARAFTIEEVSPGEGMRSPGEQTLLIDPSARGSELAVIGSHANTLQGWLRQAYERPMAALRRELDEVEVDPAFADPVARRERENQITRQMRGLNFMALEQVKSFEHAIGTAIGDQTFSFSAFDLDAARGRSAPVQYQ